MILTRSRLQTAACADEAAPDGRADHEHDEYEPRSHWISDKHHFLAIFHACPHAGHLNGSSSEGSPLASFSSDDGRRALSAMMSLHTSTHWSQIATSVLPAAISFLTSACSLLQKE